ncbi:hypothetical protein GCM10027280_22410 [Micromonospora polyrhachis]|uniref:Microcompartment protein CcmL/EutN n=1 Tax=Micromonospora polyrhachis TaxID=1282883 RepID=A0A7W7WSL8_9ACTN|nr:hypothetical protein [Micromonospora polyrhachis]MBB4961548.1 microcompartment protein CcmL/EutN [Micromonospora polyrhachis]
MNIGEVKAAIQAGIEASERSSQLMDEVRGKVCQTHELAEVTAQDSQHDTLTKGLQLLKAVDREITLTQRRLADGTSAADKYLRSL